MNKYNYNIQQPTSVQAVPRSAGMNEPLKHGRFYDCSVLQGSQILNFLSREVLPKMTEVYVKVEPDSNNFEVERGAMPLFKLESKAEKGKANSELLDRLEGILNEKPGIVSGHKSRRKKIVVDMSEDEFKRKVYEV